MSLAFCGYLERSGGRGIRVVKLKEGRQHGVVLMSCHSLLKVVLGSRVRRGRKVRFTRLVYRKIGVNCA